MWIIIDELNTGLNQALLAELLISGFSSLHPKLKSIPSNVRFAVIQNPFRVAKSTLRQAEENSKTGSSGDSLKVELENKVNPTNNSLLMANLIDFSDKTNQKEDVKTHITSTIKNQLDTQGLLLGEEYISFLSDIVQECQHFLNLK